MEGSGGAGPAIQSPACSFAERIRHGDRAAEEELVKTYRRGLVLIIAERIHDADSAPDLAHDVLIAVLRALRDGRVREPEKLSAFIHGTARNLINDFLRGHFRRAECALGEVELPSREPWEEHESEEQQRLLRRELESYGPIDRQILLWSLVDGRSLVEIAKSLEMSHSAVSARKSRLVRKIIQKFSEMSQK